MRQPGTWTPEDFHRLTENTTWVFEELLANGGGPLPNEYKWSNGQVGPMIPTDCNDTRPYMHLFYDLVRGINTTPHGPPPPSVPIACVQIGVRRATMSLAMLTAIRDRPGNGILVDVECDPASAEISARAVKEVGGPSLSQYWRLVQGYSHEPSTLEAVKIGLRQINGQDRPIDFLFIDGDHTHEAITNDLAIYAPLVRPVGGMILVHDSVMPEVSKALRELTDNFPGKYQAVNFPWSMGMTMLQSMEG